MEPALKVGGIIVTRPVRLEAIEVGDIIAFQKAAGRTAHRVVDIISISGRPWFQTKGDKNNEPDPFLVSSADGKIRRVVHSLPYLGFVSQFVHSRFIPFLINLPALVLAWWLGKQMWAEIQKQKTKRSTELERP
jgi:signal peptidase